LAIDLIIFDLDGTLADTKLDLANAVNAARERFGLMPLKNELIYSYVGNGAPVLIRKAMGPECGDEDVQRALEHFLSHYRQHMLEHTTLYPGVRESLERLRAAGVQLAVLTNKPVKISHDMLAGLGVGELFFRVYGGNSFEQKKPEPDGVFALLEEAGVAKENTLMVGDSSVDVLTARNAGIAVCGVTYGFQPESLAGEIPDILADSVEDLTDMVIADRSPRGATQS
jgi:phosphoglycolate phosphatase